MNIRERLGLIPSKEPSKEHFTNGLLKIEYGLNDFYNPDSKRTVIPVEGVSNGDISIAQIYTRGLTEADPRTIPRIRLSQLVAINFNGGSPFSQTLVGLREGDGTNLLIARRDVTPQEIGPLDYWQYPDDFTILDEGTMLNYRPGEKTTPFWMRIEALR